MIAGAAHIPTGATARGGTKSLGRSYPGGVDTLGPGNRGLFFVLLLFLGFLPALHLPLHGLLCGALLAGHLGGLSFLFCCHWHAKQLL
jgi:hypothetical protein